MSSMSSRNQSSPRDGPACSAVSLIGTLAPPNRVAARANSIPVRARIFFLRSMAETTPHRIAATMIDWIAMRSSGIG